MHQLYKITIKKILLTPDHLELQPAKLPWPSPVAAAAAAALVVAAVAPPSLSLLLELMCIEDMNWIYFVIHEIHCTTELYVLFIMIMIKIMILNIALRLLVRY